MSSPATTPTDVAAAIRALDVEFAFHANAHDAAALTEIFYTEDAQLLPPNAPLVRGKAAIRDFWTAFMTAGPSDASLQSDTIDASGDLAYCTGRYAFTMGGERHEGKYVVVYRRQADGGYKAIADAFGPNA